MRSDPSLNFDPDSDIGTVLPIEQNPGVSHSGHERDHLFINLGGTQYMDVGALSGLDDPSDGRTFALFDYDRDGWLDFAMMNANNPLSRLYRNKLGDRPGAAERGRMVALRFRGANTSAQASPGSAPRDGYGAQARLTIEDGRTLLREYRCGEGLAAQNTAMLLVGIGSSATVPKLEVTWPSGKKQELARVAAGSLVTAYEDPAQSPDGSGFAVGSYGAKTPLPDTKKSQAVLANLRIQGADTAPVKLITTMATWCPKCKGELPQIEVLRSAFPKELLTMQGVCVDSTDTPEMVAQYVQEHQPAYEMVTNLSAGDVQAIKAVVRHTTGIEGDVFPATLVTDRSGRVLYSTTGVPSVSDVRKVVQRVQSGG